MYFRAMFAVVLFAFIAVGMAISQPPPGRRGPREIKERSPELTVDLKEPPAALVQNPRFWTRSSDPKIPAYYKIEGDAAWVYCSTTDEYTDAGVALYSQKKSGGVTQDVTGFAGGVGKWFRFSFRGLAEPNFAVEKDGLFMRVEYLGKNGSLDGVTRQLDPLVERDRKELAVNGVRGKNGGAVWKTYAFEFRLPFNEIDTLRLGVGFRNGIAKSTTGSEFYVTEFALMPIPAPDDAPKIIKTEKGPMPNITSLISLGGRWYYDPEPSMKERPARLIVNAKNANRLYYRDDRLSNPFAENMTAWLRKGNLDLNGKLVEEDRFLPDNLVLEFKDGKEMIVHARGIPNHPTAAFPGRNPNSIQEMDRTYYLPLEPTKNPKAAAMDKTNSNRALPMGSIGVAINGVPFFNPFDMEGTEAVDIMDRCCGHPAPDNQYHYHKYPVCVKTPFIDDGEGPSPLIGFALDGFPIYGPYVSKGVMARDVKDNPLDAFNMRFDDERGWHYHVTPGKYPYIIGGFAGVPDPRNLRRGPPR